MKTISANFYHYNEKIEAQVKKRFSSKKTYKLTKIFPFAVVKL